MKTSASLPPGDPRLGMPTRTDPARKSLATKLAASPNRCPWTAALLAAAMLCLTALPGRAADGDVDPGFDPSANGAVLSAVAQADGKILLGGSFTSVGGATRYHVARLNADGTLDAGFDPNVNDYVESLSVQPDGKIVMGGFFTTVGGTPRYRLARLNVDGSPDAGFFDQNIQASVECVALQADGRIVLGGEFSTLGVTTRNHIARVVAEGYLDTTFNPNADDTVMSLAVQPDGRLLLGGRFHTVGGQVRNHLARVAANGAVDFGFNPNAGNRVDCIVVQPDGKILVGGWFLTMGGQVRNHIARLNAAGTLDTAFNPNANGDVESLALQADGKILIGGYFTNVGGVRRNRIARLNADGTLDTSFDPNASDTVDGVALQADGKVLLAGWFTTVGGVARNRIARLENGPATQTLSASDVGNVQWLRGGTAPEIEQVTFDLSTDGGTTWTALGSGTRITGGWAVAGLSLPPVGSVRARGRTSGGFFNTSSGLIEQVAGFAFPAEIGVVVEGTALVDEVSTVSFGTVESGQSGPTRTFTVTNVGGLDLTLGAVTLAGDQAGDYLLDTSGLAGTVGPGQSTTFTVAFHPSGDGWRRATLQIASNDGDESPFDIALAGRQTRVDGSFNPAANGFVGGLAVQADGKVLLGGEFTMVGGTARNYLARLHADGTLDPGFNPNANGSVGNVAVQTDGKVLMGGLFTMVGGTTRNYLARVNADGTLDPAFDPNPNSNVYCMAVQTDGKILVGGNFTTINGKSRSRIARLNPDGTFDAGFNPIADNVVSCVAVQADGKILLGGNFTSVGGTARGRIARLQADGTLDPGFDPNANLSVNSMAVQADGKILLGGGFTTVGGTGRNHLARLHADGTLDAGFNPNADAAVRSLAVQADGKVLLGGDFTTVGGAAGDHIARLHADGTLDTGFDAGASLDVASLALQADGRILVGSGTRNIYLARLLNEAASQTLVVPDATQVGWLRGGTAPEVEQVTFEVSVDGGATWTALGSGTRSPGGWTVTGLILPSNGSIRARGRTTGGLNNGSSGLIEQVASYALPDIGVLADGTPLADGVGAVSFGTVRYGQAGPTVTFTVANAGVGNLTLGAVTLTGSAAGDYLLDTTGLVTTLASGASTTFTVTFHPTLDGTRTATLQIASNDADESPFDIALSGLQTRVAAGFNPSANAVVHAVVTQADGKILLGGNFTSVAGTARNFIARLNADGTLDPGFNPNAGGSIVCVAVQADGKILLGGGFTTVGGTIRNRIARVNADGTLDPGFNPNASNEVDCVAVQADGKILLSGWFTTVGGTARNRIARLNADGTLDPGFNPSANNYVNCMAVQTDGKILLSGGFTTVGGTVRNRIARVNADGTLDAGFNPNASRSVISLAIQADGKILLVGAFGSVGGAARNGIARLNADGTLDPGFNPNAGGVPFSMAVQTDGKILLAGDFSSMGGTTRNRIARLHADGTLDMGFNSDADSFVYSVAVQTDGQILLGGDFTSVGGVACGRIARLLNEPATQTFDVPDATQVRWLRGGTAPEVEQVTFELSVDGGTTWAALGSGARITGGWATTGLSLPLTGAIRARGRATGGFYNGSSSLIEQASSYALPPDIGVLADGTDLVNGVDSVSFGTIQFGQTSPPMSFTITNGGGRDLTLEAVTLTGNEAGDYLLDTSSLATPVAPGESTTFTVTFGPRGDGVRAASLHIASNDPDEAPFDIALSGTGTRVDGSFNPSANNYVYTVAGQPDGKVLLGGSFTTVNGVARNRLARLNADGTLDPGFNPNAGGGLVNCATVQADGKILVGGAFTTMGGTARSRLARLNADGTLDPGFNPNANGSVNCLAPQADGKILLGGSFTSVSGTARNRVARLNADGTLDPGFNPNANDIVYSVAVQADARILLGGIFTTVGGVARNRIARLNADGTLDPDFNPNASSNVQSVTVQADGRILLGGAFTTVSGVPRNCLARLNADGTLDPDFNPNVNNQIHSVVVQADGQILLGGNFSMVGEAVRSYLARLHADGTLDAGFQQDANNEILSVAVQADGRILLGGYFTGVGGVACNRIARLLNEPATQALTVPDPGQVQWLRGGTAPEVGQVAFELSIDGGSTWNALGGGTRIAGGWAQTGLSLPTSGLIRARGRATGGCYNGSSTLIEQVASYVLPPDIGVLADGTQLVDGVGTVSFGTVLLGQASLPLTFTVTNTGGANLTLGAVTLTGNQAGDYLLDTSGLVAALAPGASTTFIVSFNPTADGLRCATLQIASNDPDESPFDIALSGTQTRVDSAGFSPNVGGGLVNSAVVQADGKILLGGEFTTVAGTTRNHLARLNADGTLDTGFNPNADAAVLGLAVQADGKILLVGDFTSVGGTTRNFVARLNADGTLDSGFNPATTAAGFIRCVALQTDGKILLGGNFNIIGDGLEWVSFSIARLNADGTLDADFDPPTDFPIFCVAIQPDGRILLGGGFYSPHPRLARLNADGTPDLGFAPNPMGEVYCVAVQPDGKILLGGQLGYVGGTERANIARVNADGTLDAAFNPNARWGNVLSVALQADGKILLGGWFTSVGGTARNGIARVNADGTLDTGFNPNVAGGTPTVHGLALQADGGILLTGSFTTVDGIACQGLARLRNEPAAQALSIPDATQVQWLRGGTAPEVEQATFELSINDGSTWTALGSGTRIAGGWTGTGLSLPASGLIRARGRATAGQSNGSSSLIEQVSGFDLPPEIGVLADGANLADGVGTVSFGTVLLGQSGPTVTFTVTNIGGANLTLGAVTLSGSEAGDYLLDTSGLAVTVAAGESTTFTVAFRPTADGLRSASLQIASNDPDESPFDVALSGTQTRVDSRFNPNVVGSVFCSTVQADGRILLGGSFFNVGGMARNRLARLYPDGMLDPGFNPNVGGPVFNISVQADGRILLGGGFTMVGGVPRNRIARLNADGTLDPGFNPNANSTVSSTAMQADGKILLGGSFTSVGGTARNYLARLNADGTLDPDFNPNPSGIVFSVVVQADGRILLGGGFTTVGGVTRNRLARLNADGTLDPDFNPNANNNVQSVAVQADGRILLGGTFTTVSEVTRNHLARLNPNGTLDPDFDPNVNSIVLSTVAQADGKILLGGNFTSVGGTPRAYFARLNGDGTLDAGFRQDASAFVYSVALQADGQILLGGNFINVGGVVRNRFARLLNEPATQTLHVPDPTQVHWMRGGTAPEVEQVTFEFSTDWGATWTALGGGARIAGGWATTGLSLPPSGLIRALGRATAGQYNGSSGVIEQVAGYAGPTPEIAVVLNGDQLADGVGTVNFGTVLLGQAGPPLTFTISNPGTANLTLGAVTIAGSGADDYLLDTSGLSASLATGASTTFTVTFHPTGDGLRSATLQLASNDPDESPFDIALAGTQTRVDSAGFNPHVGGAFVYGVAVQADGKILLGGDFTSVGEMARNFIARLNVDGTLDPGFNPDVGYGNSHVSCLAVQRDGKILLGGSLNTVGGIARNGIARLNPDGTLDVGFNPNVNSYVHSIVVQADGKILLGGLFSMVGGTARNCIARLHADGTLDPGFNPTPNDCVYGLAVQADGKILLGGAFMTVGVTERHHLARLNADGTLDPGFNPNLNSDALSMVPQADGKILLGGGFTTVGGVACNHIARLNADGTLDPSFNPDTNGLVRSLAVQVDGRILLGGAFTMVGGTARVCIARLNADGTLDTSLDPNVEWTSYYTSVHGLAVQADGGILLTGNFTTVGGIASQCVARLLNEPATQALSIPAATQVQWLRGGTAPEVEQVTFELSADGGATWTPLGTGGTRISGGWAETGLSLPASGLIRARGRATTGQYNGSSSLIEQVTSYVLLPELRVTRFVRNGNGTFTIEWLGDGILQVSETLADWQDVVGATSPYTFPPTASRLFARIRR
ncbi:MAG: choice-of-anchor D domain-containing protein [Verrucomicrobia bacterium]|nr:choice-of-anchor D domain-containing protein [Verrucomicrobiota bacterium]